MEVQNQNTQNVVELPLQNEQQQPIDENAQAEAYFASQYDRYFKAAKRAAREGIAACDKLEALAVLNGKGTEEGKGARSYFRMASNKLDKTEEA